MEVRLSVVDVRGRRLMEERRTVISTGWNRWILDPKRVGPHGLDSGIYYLLLGGSDEFARARVVVAR